MLIDIIALVLLVVAIFKGLSRGFIVAFFSLVAFIVGLAAAIKLSAVAATYIGRSVNISERWLPVLAFVVVFLIVVFLVRLGARAIEGVVRMAMLGWLNRLGGVLFYALLYLFIYSLILFYATRINVIKPETAQASATYSYIAPLGPKVIEGLSAVVPLFENMFQELELFFDGVSKKTASVPVAP